MFAETVTELKKPGKNAGKSRFPALDTLLADKEKRLY